MSSHKKDHAVGTGAGTIGGVVAGAAIGSAAGPAGTVIGAVAGGVAGAKAGDAIAERINPGDYDAHFQRNYRHTPYYSSGREWGDYGPAYRYGYDTYPEYRGQRFEDVETRLEHDWQDAKADSRLAWAEARDAVRDGWHHIEHAIPGDADHDGR